MEFERFMENAERYAQPIMGGEFKYQEGDFVVFMVPVQQRTRAMRPHFRNAFYIRNAAGNLKRTSKDAFVRAIEGARQNPHPRLIGCKLQRMRNGRYRVLVNPKRLK